MNSFILELLRVSFPFFHFTVCVGEGFSHSAGDHSCNRAVTEGVNANTVLSPSALVEA